MSQNQEIIEAKLCAYIDDELDAQGRAEIEKHLAGNPQHRRLIEELRRTSLLLHDLPHESAPAELAEAFNSQLERSVLLEGVSDDSIAAGQARQWPQLLATAAIIVLTVSLAAVVYLVLPGFNSRPQIAQVAPSPEAAARRGENTRVAEAVSPHEVTVQRAGEGAKVVTAPTAALQQQSATQSAVAASPAPAVAAPPLPDEARLLASGGGGDASRLVLLVESGNADAARQAVTAYLDDRHISWIQPAAATAPADLPSATVQPATRSTAEEPALPPDAPVVESSAGTAAPPSTAPSAALAAKDQASRDVDAAALDKSKDAGVSADSAAHGIELRRRQLKSIGPLTKAPSNDVFVSCRMTRAQAQELAATLTDKVQSSQAMVLSGDAPADISFAKTSVAPNSAGAVAASSPATQPAGSATPASPAAGATSVAAARPSASHADLAAAPATQPAVHATEANHPADELQKTKDQKPAEAFTGEDVAGASPSTQSVLEQLEHPSIPRPKQESAGVAGGEKRSDLVDVVVIVRSSSQDPSALTPAATSPAEPAAPSATAVPSLPGAADDDAGSGTRPSAAPDPSNSQPPTGNSKP